MEQKDKLGTKRACITCGREFDWDVITCPDDNTPLTALGEEDQLVGTVLAERYEIMEVIGGGGMGLVYKARHKLMNRIVAIKMLHKHMISSKDTLKRFQLEAQAASCLSLPNILTVYDFGLTAEGQPYMVMDYLEGTSLSDVLEQEHHLTPDRAVNIFIQACAGLAHAHQKGVLHRDIKPSNIMLVHFADQADFVKIVDFGIAKLLNQGVGELTKTGEVYGSPSYMSPEQCRGKETDARSDIYSMGCVMYRTLTGRPLFSGDDIIELLFKQVSEPPEPFDPELNIPKELESAIFKALAKDPIDRYQTMGEFKEALEKYVEKRSGKGTATPTVEGPMPLWKRAGESGAASSPVAKTKSSVSNPVPELPAAAAAAAASAAQIPAVAYEAPLSEAAKPSEQRARGGEALPPKSRSAEAAQNQSSSAREDNSNGSSGNYTSQNIPMPDTKHGASVHLRKKMADGNKVLIISIAAVSAVVVLIGGGIFAYNAMQSNTTTGGQTASSGKNGSGNGGFDQGAVNLPDANAQAAFMTGRESFKNKKYDDARIELEEALALTEKGSGMSSKELVPVLSELALVYRKLDKLTLAANQLKRAIPIQEKAGGKKDVKLAALDYQLAQIMHEDGRPKDADVYGKKALHIAKTTSDPGAPKVSEIETFLSTNIPGSLNSIKEETPKAADITPAKTEQKPVSKPETSTPETATNPETKPEIAKPVTKIDVPVAATKPVSKPETKPETKPEAKPEADAVTRVASTQNATPSASHAAPHIKHVRHASPSHHASPESSGGGASPVRHRRAYSSYGF